MSNTPRFARKSMVVTGAAQGIGKQVAIDAAGEGARVALVDRSPLVEAVAAEIVASGGQAVSVVTDLETWEGNVEAMKTAHKAHGAVDILVTNVGGAIWMKPFQHFDERQIAAGVQRSLFPTPLELPRRAALHAGAGTRRHRECLLGCDQGCQPGPVFGSERRRQRFDIRARL